MKRFHLWLFAALILAMMIAGCSDHSSPVNPNSNANTPARVVSAAGPHGIPDHYIVVFKLAVADVDQTVDDISKRQNVVARNRYKHAIRGFAARLSPSQLEALRNDSRVDYIEQDQTATVVATQLNATWGLDRTDQRTLPLNTTYTYNHNGAGVDVYILDTGIRQTHVDFGGRAITGYDAITPGGAADDMNGHGTHVAGTIGGSTYGVAKGVRLIAVRVLGANGSGAYSQIIAGVDWVTGHHTTRPAVANMSLGGPVSSALDYAVRNSIADGVTYCVAAGNSTVDASTKSPAHVAEAVTVGATDRYDRFASFSNFGAIVDLLAPGVGITSDYYTSNTAVVSMSGTSMAAPHVAGAAAVYLAANPGATPAQVQTGLIASATGGLVTSVPYGTPNRLLYSMTSTTVVTPPTAPTLLSPANGAASMVSPVTVSWNASTGASSYRVQVSTVPEFTTLTADRPGLATTSTSLSGLAASTTYHWRVNAENSTGTSAWSAVRSFTTAAGARPNAPTLASPVNGANNVPRTATLRWNASTGATSYRVQVSTSSAFSTMIADRSGLTATSTTISGLGSHVYYYWRVSATNANGTSAWSSVWRFRTAK